MPARGQWSSWSELAPDRARGRHARAGRRRAMELEAGARGYGRQLAAGARGWSFASGGARCQQSSRPELGIGEQGGVATDGARGSRAGERDGWSVRSTSWGSAMVGEPGEHGNEGRGRRRAGVARARGSAEMPWGGGRIGSQSGWRTCCRVCWMTFFSSPFSLFSLLTPENNSSWRCYKFVFVTVFVALPPPSWNGDDPGGCRWWLRSCLLARMS